MPPTEQTSNPSITSVKLESSLHSLAEIATHEPSIGMFDKFSHSNSATLAEDSTCNLHSPELLPGRTLETTEVQLSET